MSLLASSAHFLTSSRLVRYFRLTAPAAVLGHLGVISLKNLTKRKEVRKGADQAKYVHHIFSGELGNNLVSNLQVSN